MQPPEWQLMNWAAQKSDKLDTNMITIHTTSDVKRSKKVCEEARREQRRRLEGEGRRIPTLDDDDDDRIILHPQIANRRHYPNCPENPEPPEAPGSREDPSTPESHRRSGKAAGAHGGGGRQARVWFLFSFS